MHRRLPPGVPNGWERFKQGDEVIVHFTGKVCQVEGNTVTIRIKDKHAKSGYRQIQMPVDLVEHHGVLDKMARIPNDGTVADE